MPQHVVTFPVVTIIDTVGAHVRIAGIPAAPLALLVVVVVVVVLVARAACAPLARRRAGVRLATIVVAVVVRARLAPPPAGYSIVVMRQDP